MQYLSSLSRRRLRAPPVLFVAGTQPRAPGPILRRMSLSAVAVLRQIYESWGRGDLRAGVELFDPHVLLVIQPDFPDAGTYCGPDEVRGYMRQLLSAFDDFTISGEEFIDAGDSVVVRVRQRATGTGSGAPTRHDYFQVWSFRGKSVIRIESIRDRADALGAVGLGE